MLNISLGAMRPAPLHSFTIAIGAEQTSNLLFDASAADIQAAIEALVNVQEDEVTVTSTGTNAWQMNLSGSILAGGVVATVFHQTMEDDAWPAGDE